LYAVRSGPRIVGQDGVGTTLFDTWFWSPGSNVAAPKVSKVSPNNGPPGGGTVVFVTGSNLSGATAVHFGSSAAHIDKTVSVNEIEVTSPKGPGTVDVTVITAHGTSTKTAADHFSYVAAAKVSKVSPHSGTSSRH
jgi:adenosylcobinamide amidohydrolase